MEENSYVSNKRKFNDAWAFVLYVIYYLGCNSFLAMSVDSKDTGSFNPKLFLVLSTSTLCLIVFNFIAFSYFCEFTLKFSMVLFPLVQIVLLVLFPNPISIFFGVIGILIWLFFISYYWSRIPTIAKMFSYATKICLKHFFACFFAISLCSFVQIAQIVLTSMVFPSADRNTSMVIIALLVLNFYWTLANFTYFFKVYVSSIIAYHFIEYGGERIDVFSGAFSNTLYALGSISYAGLVLAAVQTLKYIVISERNRNREEERRSILVDIILCLCLCIISLLEDVIKFANEFSMPYIAIHGCGYVQSVKESYRLITNRNSVAMCGVTMLNCALFLFSLLMMGITFVLTYFFSLQDVKLDFSDKLFLNSCINTLIAVCVVYYTTMSLFVSSYLALIYLHTERPQLISNVDEEIAEICRKAKED
ncbi:Protein PNS1 [Nosema granulosis]|uniref:Protein PNS1 n=1 Tax=Nosema granulosis TaxID=83296 RepID=A0A9P6GZ83_9MICR|nr:Protein PNS1 [Nosema granulosis]